MFWHAALFILPRAGRGGGHAFPLSRRAFSREFWVTPLDVKREAGGAEEKKGRDMYLNQ
jgi:hypothetical protein